MDIELQTMESRQRGSDDVLSTVLIYAAYSHTRRTENWKSFSGGLDRSFDWRNCCDHGVDRIDCAPYCTAGYKWHWVCAPFMPFCHRPHVTSSYYIDTVLYADKNVINVAVWLSRYVPRKAVSQQQRRIWAYDSVSALAPVCIWVTLAF